MARQEQQSLRSQEIRGTVDQFLDTHREWQDSDAERRPNPDAIYWDAVDQMIAVYENGGIPADCRELCRRLDEFIRELNEFDNRDNAMSLMPKKAFFTAVDKLIECRTQEHVEEAPFKQLEPILDLAALPNMGIDQIARMYGLTTKSGQPRLDFVSELIVKLKSAASKGDNTVADVLDLQKKLLDEGCGGEWIDPRVLERESRRKTRTARREENAERREQMRTRDEEKCPETPKQLFLQGVDEDQAAKMLRMPLAEVQEIWTMYRQQQNHQGGGDAPVQGAASDATAQPRPEKKASRPSLAERAAARTQPKVSSDDKIRIMADEGHSVKSIADTLGISQGEVKAALDSRVPVAVSTNGDGGSEDDDL